jgi:hypothetical protein
VLFGKLGDEAATMTNNMFTQLSGAIVTRRSAAATQEALDKPAKFGGEDEVQWILEHGLRERSVAEANSGAVGTLREIGDDPETQVLMAESANRLRQLAAEWRDTTPGGRPKAVILAEMRRVRAALTGDATAYEEENERIVAELRSAITIAVQIGLAVAPPGVGSSFVATMAMNIGANVATNMVIWGEQYSLDSFRNDILGGVLGGIGGKFGQEFASAVASRVTGTAAKGTIEAAERVGLSVGIAKQAGAAANMASEGSLAMKLISEAGEFGGSAVGGTMATGQNQFTLDNAVMNVVTKGAASVTGRTPQPASDGGPPTHGPDGVGSGGGGGWR